MIDISHRQLALALAAAGLLAVAPAHALTYQATFLGNLAVDPPVGAAAGDYVTSQTSANAINASGQVVGSARLLHTTSYYDPWSGNTYPSTNDWGSRAIRSGSGGQAQNLGTLGTDSTGLGSSYATAINTTGQITGSSDFYEDGLNKGQRAFRYSASTGMVNLGTLGGNPWVQASSFATAINNQGQVVGGASLYSNWDNKGTRAFRYTDGVGMVNLGALGTDANGSASSHAMAINDKGQVVGMSSYYEGTQYKGQRAFLYTDGVGMQNLGVFGGVDHTGSSSSLAYDINSAGQVVGASTAYNADGIISMHVFRYTDGGGMVDLGNFGSHSLGVASAMAFDINEAGQVVGNSDNWQSNQLLGERAFRYTDGEGMIDLGTFSTDSRGYGRSFAHALNNAGQVVGSVSIFQGDTEVGQHAAVSIGNSFVDLNGLLDAPLGDWVLTDATAINDAGQIAVNGYSSTFGQGAFLLSLADIPNPILPDLVEPGGVFSFSDGGNSIDVGGQSLPGGWFDPEVAVGYTYEMLTAGVGFTGVQVPNPYGDGAFKLWLFDAASGDYVDSGIVLTAGEWYAFGEGVDKFRITGIEPAANVNPDDPNGFVTGLTFSQSGAEFSMTALRVETAYPVPEADTYALILAGMGLVGAMARRRKHA